MPARLTSALLAAGAALFAAGCSQTVSPQATEQALSGPLVLNSAQADGAAPLPAASSPVVATAPVIAPAAPPAPAATALQSAPAAVPAASAAADEGQFPNINKPPTQPAGAVLPADARAQIIADLEKLRDGQAAPKSAAGGGNPADLVNAGATHGQAAIRQIETCSQDGALQTNPDCAPD